MIIELEQEECLRTRVCVYCKSNMYQDNLEYNPGFFACPNHCMRVWYAYHGSTITDKWAGFRVYLGNSICFRYYNGSSDLEIRVPEATYHMPEEDHFNIFSYSIADLAEKVDRLLFLADL